MADRLEEVVTRLRAFVAEREWGQSHDPKNLSMAVASKAGELLAEYRWLASDASDAWSREPENKRRAAMEAAQGAALATGECSRRWTLSARGALRSSGARSSEPPAPLEFSYERSA